MQVWATDISSDWGTMRQLSMMDASFLYMERPSTPSHVLPVFVYDPSTAPGKSVSFDDIMGTPGAPGAPGAHAA